MKTLYFIRHGQSQMNVEKRFAGKTDTPLTEEGRQQAKSAGKKAKGQNLRIDLIVSSPLSRAHETARIIAREIGYPEGRIELNPMLAERNFGSLEGQLWVGDLNMDGIADMETIDELLARAAEVIAWLKQLEPDNILVVSHGSLGRALRHHLKGIQFEEFDKAPEHMLIPNAEI